MLCALLPLSPSSFCYVCQQISRKEFTVEEFQQFTYNVILYGAILHICWCWYMHSNYCVYDDFIALFNSQFREFVHYKILRLPLSLSFAFRHLCAFFRLFLCLFISIFHSMLRSFALKLKIPSRSINYCMAKMWFYFVLYMCVYVWWWLHTVNSDFSFLFRINAISGFVLFGYYCSTFLF